MMPHQWLRQLAQRWSVRDGNRRRRSGRVSSSTRRRVRPRLEVLEERLTPSTLDSLSFTQAQAFGSAVAPNQPSGAVTVQLQDSSGHALAATSNVTVKLSSSSSTGEFLDLSGKPLANNGITIAAGSSYAYFEYEDSQIGQMTIKGLSDSPFAFGGINLNIQDRLAFTTSPQTLLPGQVSQPVTIQLQDANGKAVTAASNLTILLGGSTTVKFLDTSGNALANNSITIAAGSNSASFKFEDSQAEDAFVSASTITGANASQLETVAYSLAFTTSPQIVAPNQKSGPIAIQLQDGNGNAVKATSAVTIDLSSTSFTGKFFDASGNPLPASPFGFGALLTVDAGSDSAKFEYQDSATQETATITAQGQGSNGGNFGNSVQQQVYIGDPFAITTPGQTIEPGKPSQPMTIQLQTAATNGETILLSSSSSTGKFLDASGNPLSTNSGGSYILPVATGATSVNFKYEDSTTGLPTITAETSDLSFATEQQENVGVSMKFTTPPRTVAQSQQSDPITVQLQDSSGNPFKAPSPSGVSLILTSSSGGQFFDTTGNPTDFLTIAGGSSSASFKYENSFASGNQTVTAALLGLGAPTLSASQQETVTAPAFTTVAFISPTQTIAANQASQPITVQLLNNGAAFTATSAVTIKLSSTSSTGKFLDTSGKALTNNSITIAAGSSTASFEYEDSQEWFPSLTATVSGTFMSGNQTVNVGGVSLAFATTAQPIAAGSPSGTITVQLQDSKGKAVTNQQSFPVSVSLTSNSQTGEFLDTTGAKLTGNSISIAAGASSANFKYEDSVGGKPTLSANAFVATSLSATQQETVTGPYKVVLSLPVEGALTVNQASKPMVVELMDSTGSLVTASSAVAVKLSSSSSGGKFLDTSGTALPNDTITIAKGSGSASFEYEDSQVGLPTLTASENGFSSSQLEVVGVKTVFTTSAQTLAAGQISQPVTVQLQDSSGKPVATPSDLSLYLIGNFPGSTSFLASEEAGVQFLDTSGKPLSVVNGLPALTFAAGKNSASFEFSSLVGGTLTVTTGYGFPFSSLGAPSLLTASQNETVQGLSTLAFTTSQQTLTAGQMSGTVTIQLKDNNGKPANAPSGGLAVTLSLGSVLSSLSSSTSSPTKFFDAKGNPLSGNQQGLVTITIPEGSSTASFEFQSTQAGSLSLFASASNGLSASQTETIQPAQPSSVAFVAPSQSLAAGTPSGSITVQLEDKFGNAITAGTGGLTFSLSSSSSTGHFLSASGDFLSSPSITIPSGFSSATFEYEDSQSGTPTLTASASGVSGTQQETVASTTAEIHVTNTNDSGKDSLRAAIDAANAAPGSTIVFNSGVTGTIHLLSELPNIFFNTNIIGPGANVLTIDRSSSAASTFGGLTIGFQSSTFAPAEPIVTISGLTLNNFDGTGINDYGNLTVRQVDVSNTQALMASGAPSNLSPSLLAQGGIVSQGTLTVLSSTAAGNAHSGIYGSNLTVINSTITGNTGGGITALGMAYVVSSTISGNTDTDLPEFFSASLNNFAGGITSVGSVALYDTIVAGNTGPASSSGFNGAHNSNDVVGGFLSLGHNLIGQADSSSSSGFVSGGDLVGTTANPIDPKLGALGNNGGPTQTMALLPGSPALGAGSSANNAPATDQRGELRPQQGVIDIGAFELTGASSSSAPVVTHNPNSVTVAPGHSASFTASASGNPNPTVQWYVSTNGGSSFSIITGATSPTLTIGNVTAAMNGNQYRAVFTNSVGSVTTSAATLTVGSTPPGSSHSPPHSPPAPPVLNVPPLLAFLNSLFGGVVTVNANGTETITDSIFGITLFVSTFDASGNLVSVTIFGIDITFLFLLL